MKKVRSKPVGIPVKIFQLTPNKVYDVADENDDEYFLVGIGWTKKIYWDIVCSGNTYRY